MRFVLALALLLTAVAADKQKMEMMKWMKYKAMESCFGEDVMRGFMIKMKKAAAKCSGQDVPELDLPIFEVEPFKLVSTFSQPSRDSGANFERIMEKYLQMQMLKQFSGGNEASPRFRRFKRQSDDDEDEVESVFDLGDRLNTKLMMKKEKMEAKLGNMTCMLRECGMFSEDNKFDLTKFKADMKKIKLDPWLDDKMEKSCDACEKLAKNLPEEMLEDCVYGPELGKLYMYKKCMKMAKFQHCMNFDIKKKLEKNFGSVGELVSKTGLEENMLFHVVKEMLKGPEEMMM